MLAIHRGSVVLPEGSSSLDQRLNLFISLLEVPTDAVRMMLSQLVMTINKSTNTIEIMTLSVVLFMNSFQLTNLRLLQSYFIPILESKNVEVLLSGHS